MSVIPDSDFGARVRERLQDEELVWLTTIGADGTPQPNPVWFLWEDATDSVLIYNANGAHRLGHVASRPRVSLNFDSQGDGEDIVVLAGDAEPAPDVPAAHEHEGYFAKYATGIDRIGSDPAKFGADYGAAMRVRVTKVRGF